MGAKKTAKFQTMWQTLGLACIALAHLTQETGMNYFRELFFLVKKNWGRIFVNWKNHCVMLSEAIKTSFEP